MPKWERTLDWTAVCSKTASAMGERQMLPRQTKSTFDFLGCFGHCCLSATVHNDCCREMEGHA